MNSTHGASFLASSKAARSALSKSPRWPFACHEAKECESSGTPQEPASARANSVFPRSRRTVEDGPVLDVAPRQRAIAVAG